MRLWDGGPVGPLLSHWGPRRGGRQQRRGGDDLLRVGEADPVVSWVHVHSVGLIVERAQPGEIPGKSLGRPAVYGCHLLPTHSWATHTVGEVVRGRAAPLLTGVTCSPPTPGPPAPSGRWSGDGRRQLSGADLSATSSRSMSKKTQR